MDVKENVDGKIWERWWFLLLFFRRWKEASGTKFRVELKKEERISLTPSSRLFGGEDEFLLDDDDDDAFWSFDSRHPLLHLHSSCFISFGEWGSSSPSYIYSWFLYPPLPTLAAQTVSRLMFLFWFHSWIPYTAPSSSLDDQDDENKDGNEKRRGRNIS